MKRIETRIPSVLLFEPRVFSDDRGFFMEVWNEKTFANLGLDRVFVQDNHSQSSRGVVRGLHYQIKQAQGKLVRVTAGRVYDVVVDLRRSSETFRQWVGVELSAENKRLLWVPPGFAHGFIALEDRTDFLYRCTDFYAPDHERTLLWNDPALGIDWPLDGLTPLTAAKDAEGRTLAEADLFP